MLADTITAISTPPGVGGIGIIRISGSRALEIAQKVFHPYGRRDVRRMNFQLAYGFIQDPVSGDFIDEVLLSVMPAPHTYTKEDVAEINCHGGLWSTQRILELVLAAGARLAVPGEFTKRAFLNGRIDLTQAEAVIDLIKAATDQAGQLAAGQLRGNLAQKLKAMQNNLLELVALIEVQIDFPDDDADTEQTEVISGQLRVLAEEITGLLREAETGKIYREGLKTVIVGKPNVGKSSLLNLLLREKRAIVTDVPGTTRDVIEEMLNIKGLPVVIMDTAGIRDTADAVEKLGVQRAKTSLEAADCILLVLDVTDGWQAEDDAIASLVRGKKGLVVFNKTDLDAVGSALAAAAEHVLPHWPQVELSTVSQRGLARLEEQIYQLATAGAVVDGRRVMVTNVRHKNQLQSSLMHLQEAQAALDSGLTLDLIAVDVRAAWEAMAEISGTVVSEQIVDQIFADFCLGK